MKPQATTEELLKTLGAQCGPEDLVSCETEVELARLTPYSRVIAAWEELKRRQAVRLREPAATGPYAVARLMKPYAADPVEHLWVIPADNALRPITIHEVCRGTMAGVDLALREVLAPVVKLAAPSFFVVHNHPAGGEPSQMDITFTWKLLEASQIFGLRLEDHIIIKPDGSHISLRDRLGWTPYAP